MDLAAAVARKDALLARIRAGIEQNLTSPEVGVTLLWGHAAFTGPRTVRVTPNDAPHEARDLTAPLIFINTGTRAAVLGGLNAAAPDVTLRFQIEYEMF